MDADQQALGMNRFHFCTVDAQPFRWYASLLVTVFLYERNQIAHIDVTVTDVSGLYAGRYHRQSRTPFSNLPPQPTPPSICCQYSSLRGTASTGHHPDHRCTAMHSLRGAITGFTTVLAGTARLCLHVLTAGRRKIRGFMGHPLRHHDTMNAYGCCLDL